MSLHRDPRAATGELEKPVSLGEMLDGRSRQLIGSAGASLGLPVSLTTPHGAPVIGGAIPDEVVARAVGELTWVDVGAGARWLTRQLVLDGVTVGVLGLGPYRPEDEARVVPIAHHVARLVGDLLAAGMERVVVARMHSAHMETADAELHQKNARLALAVARLEELDKIKSNFLATVSHELRTPLTSVIGYSEMLLEGLAGPMNAEQREYVTTVMEKGEQLLGIITGILDISRIEAGGVSLDRGRFDLSETIVSALSTVAPTARRKRLVVEAEIPPALPPVFGDRDKVRQVLVNLLSNAVKFTPEGGKVLVHAEVGALKRAGGATELRGLRISVADSGIGIPQEAMAKIFEPFFQVDNSSTREYGGTGLGLSIVRSFVNAHGGAVWVESVPGRGSTFFVTLPLAE